MTVSESQALLKVIFTGLYFDAEGKLVKAVAHSPFDKILALEPDGSVRLPAK